MEEQMEFSTILVSLQPSRMEELTETVAQVEGVEIHYRDPAGRVLITLEGENTGQVVERLKSLKLLPGIISAEMVSHYFGDEGEGFRDGVDPSPWNGWLNEEGEEMPPSTMFQRIRNQGG